MTHADIQFYILNVFKKCYIDTFPIDCFELVREFGCRVCRYRDLSERKQEACLTLSEDAVLIEETLYYNDRRPRGRIRFSMMHEMGHLLLKSEKESDANFFASNLLAPRLIIHYAGCQNAEDTANIFDLTKEAASYAFDDYTRRKKSGELKALSNADRFLYYHFYDKTQQKLIWHRHHCPVCHTDTYNSPDRGCSSCSHLNAVVKTKEKLALHQAQSFSLRREDPAVQSLLLAERNWLYGDSL